MLIRDIMRMRNAMLVEITVAHRHVRATLCAPEQ
jgi:hypothetical protein